MDRQIPSRSDMSIDELWGSTKVKGLIGQLNNQTTVWRWLGKCINIFVSFFVHTSKVLLLAISWNGNGEWTFSSFVEIWDARENNNIFTFSKKKPFFYEITLTKPRDLFHNYKCFCIFQRFSLIVYFSKIFFFSGRQLVSSETNDTCFFTVRHRQHRPFLHITGKSCYFKSTFLFVRHSSFFLFFFREKGTPLENISQQFYSSGTLLNFFSRKRHAAGKLLNHVTRYSVIFYCFSFSHRMTQHFTI